MNKIILWWKFEGRYYHLDFIKGVKNLIRWFPVIWKDRNYDTYYIYEIIKVKLKNQADYISGRDRHTRAKRDGELMRLSSRLIQKCQDEFYGMEYYDYHISKFNWFDSENELNSKYLEIDLISERFDEYFKKYPRQYKRVISGEIDRFSRPINEKDEKLIAMEIAHENQDRCRKLLFKIMERHIESWWD